MEQINNNAIEQGFDDQMNPDDETDCPICGERVYVPAKAAMVTALESAAGSDRVGNELDRVVHGAHSAYAEARAMLRAQADSEEPRLSPDQIMVISILYHIGTANMAQIGRLARLDEKRTLDALQGLAKFGFVAKPECVQWNTSPRVIRR